MILAIDTSGIQCAVAVWQQELITAQTVDKGLRHNEVLLQLVDDIFRNNGLQSDQIEAIAVSSGPGSFTGLRVGMATAKGLCRAWQIPIIAIPTLTGWAATIPENVKRVLSFMPARADEVYWQLFERNETERKAVNDVQLADVKKLASLVNGEVLLAGEGYQKHQLELRSIFHGRTIDLLDDHQIDSLVVSTARLAEPRLQRREFDDLISLEPLYCYPFPRRTE